LSGRDMDTLKEIHRIPRNHSPGKPRQPWYRLTSMRCGAWKKEEEVKRPYEYEECGDFLPTLG
jgi:hypothetical protein